MGCTFCVGCSASVVISWGNKADPLASYRFSSVGVKLGVPSQCGECFRARGSTAGAGGLHQGQPAGVAGDGNPSGALSRAVGGD